MYIYIYICVWFHVYICNMKWYHDIQRIIPVSRNWFHSKQPGDRMDDSELKNVQTQSQMTNFLPVPISYRKNPLLTIISTGKLSWSFMIPAHFAQSVAVCCPMLVATTPFITHLSLSLSVCLSLDGWWFSIAMRVTNHYQRVNGATGFTTHFGSWAQRTSY